MTERKSRKLIIYLMLLLFLSLALPLIFSIETITTYIEHSNSSASDTIGGVAATDTASVEMAAAISDAHVVTARSEAVMVSAESDYECLYPELYVSNKDVPTTLPSTPKIAYLTFDDGPSESTDIVLKTLKKENVHATFFIMGCGVGEKGEKRIRKMADAGHSIGIHTFTHDYNEIYSTVNDYLKDFNDIFNLIYDITGEKPNIFRFPGGSVNNFNKKIRKSLIAEMERRGFTYYDWNVSAEDAVGTPTKASIRKNLLKAVNFSFPVLLMHDSDASLTPSMLGDIIKELKIAGYKFDTLKNRVPIHFK